MPAIKQKSVFLSPLLALLISLCMLSCISRSSINDSICAQPLNSNNPIQTITEQSTLLSPEDPDPMYANQRQISVYDQHGSLIASMMDFLYPESDCIYRYDDQGNIAELLWYDIGGSPLSKYSFEYDESGRVTEISRKYGNALSNMALHREHTIIDYSNSENYNSIEITSYSAIGTLLTNEMRHYEDDRPIEIISSNESGFF